MDAPEPHVVAAIDLLLTIGYIDGRLHEGEQALIRSYVGQLAAAASAPPAAVDAAYAKLEAEIAGLPADSRYRNVTPMALTLRWDAGRSVATPWPIDYQPFTSGANNGFYR